MEQYRRYSDSTYEVSDTGSVRNRVTKRVLKKQTTMDGYYCVNLKINKKPKQISVHRLVATTWLLHPTTGNITVDHINRVKTDNRAVNLRWATSREQNQNRAPYKSGNARGIWKCDVDSGEKITKYETLVEAGQDVAPGNEKAFKKI